MISYPHISVALEGEILKDMKVGIEIVGRMKHLAVTSLNWAPKCGGSKAKITCVCQLNSV